ncbi:MAG: hypothetical protein O2983_09465 [Planctomycetota bacterium]|nr:hypothetical protein [Planctomycetota bacterium]MDA0920565.1 hypothetical protein [Planctomycetota bacterium]MDA1159825.1 hypothetical protein [Planctomycetota bacterium]
MIKLNQCLCRFSLLAILLCVLGSETFGQSSSEDSLTPNGSFENDRDGDNWPDGWATVKPGGEWIAEDGNHFLRLTSTAPGKMVMLYQEIAIPAGVEAIELSFRQRITGLKVGRNSWFDARILMEFLDGGRKKLTPTPSAPASRKDTDGWVRKQTSFLVPEGAKTLKFMPCLFEVDAGTFELDDVVLRPVDAAPIRAAVDAATAARLAKQQADAEKRRGKAAAILQQYGSLITNGDFETDVKKQAG